MKYDPERSHDFDYMERLFHEVGFEVDKIMISYDMTFLTMMGSLGSLMSGYINALPNKTLEEKLELIEKFHSTMKQATILGGSKND